MNNSGGLARDVRSEIQDDYQTGNYPPEGDTTSEGGYGAPNVFSRLNQRRADNSAQQTQTPTAPDPAPAPATSESRAGPSLIDESLDGGFLSSEL